MSVRNGKRPLRERAQLRIRSHSRIELLLHALNAFTIDDETPEQSAAIAALVCQIEEVLEYRTKQLSLKDEGRKRSRDPWRYDQEMKLRPPAAGVRRTA